MSQDALSHGGRPRRWTKVSWWYSLILPIALLLLVASVLIDRLGSDPALTGVVTDAYTGEPVSGAQVSAGATAVETDGSGSFAFESPYTGPISVSREDYESTQVAVDVDDEQVAIRIRPTTLTGTVTNLRTDEPLEGARVTVTSPTRATAKTVTDESGMYLLFDVPSDATVTVEHAGLSPVSQIVGNNLILDFDVHPDIIIGRIVDGAGEPVDGARVQLGEITAVSESDGSYRLSDVPGEGEIFIKKVGYREVTADYPDDMIVDVTLEAFTVRAIYVPSDVAGDEQRWEETLQLLESTEINAVVLDVKDENGIVHFDTAVSLAGEIGAAQPGYDLESCLEDLADRDIYAIARMVVFDDPLLASQRPDLAIKDLGSGESWTTWDGSAWVNSLNEEVWQYNIDLATEVAAAEFDEIQFDYLRFPTDGPIEVADYGTALDPAVRVEAMTEFLTRIQAALGTSQVFIAATVTGVGVWDESDNGIGQDLDEIVPLVDVVSPMLYPAHFPPGTFGYDFPNDHPHEIVRVNLEHTRERFGSSAFKFRPWLQDFSTGVGINYGSEEVRAQIDAAEQYGRSGWMLWNDASDYSSAALASQ